MGWVAAKPDVRVAASFHLHIDLGEIALQMYGPRLLAETLSIPTVPDKFGNKWQYHSRSDHHSKVACWSIVFDLMRHCPLLRQHVAEGIAGFGINHEMSDFAQNRKKNLDLVLCRPASGAALRAGATLSAMADRYNIILPAEADAELRALPELRSSPVGSVFVALEAKACMTAHQKARPRLYDELNSSHLTVHGATDEAIAAGFVMVNISDRFLSPGRNQENRQTEPKWNVHRQPRDARLVVEKIHQIRRRSRTGDSGYDALSIVVLNCPNDGSPVRLWEGPPAPLIGEIYHYSAMIERLAHLYSARFQHG